jgi:hypothetical protein
MPLQREYLQGWSGRATSQEDAEGDERENDMTQEEVEFMQRHPLFPEWLVPASLAELKDHSAMVFLK